MHCLDIPSQYGVKLLQVQSADCCSKKDENSKYSKLSKAVELVCRIALGIMAAVIAPVYFATSFVIGAAGGVVYTALQKIYKDKLAENADARPACAQGFMEYLSGTKFPAVVIQVVTAVFIGAHIQHQPGFYVPFTGVFVGFWSAKQASAGIEALAHKVIQKLKAPKLEELPKPCCCH